MVRRWDTRAGCWQPGAPELADVLGALGGPILAFAVEWLDDLPAMVADRTPAGRLTAVGPRGPAGDVAEAEVAWADRWWPGPGRVVIGRTRDDAWAWLARHLPPGSLLITIDYGHERADRPGDGGFGAYRGGSRVPLDPAANLTAAVAIDSLAAAVEAVGCRRLRYARLADLPAGHWPTEHPDPLKALALRSQEQLLRDRRRFGAFWLVQHLTAGHP